MPASCKELREMMKNQHVPKMFMIYTEKKKMHK